MTDLSVIILVGREERHIRRCLERLAPLEPRQVFVVESQSGDRTHEIAAGLGAATVWRDWPGNQAEQFDWALDNLPLEGSWILRLDADEYLTDETVVRLKTGLAADGGGGPFFPDAAGLTLELKRRFRGGDVRHGTGGIREVRLFRRGRARYGGTPMDERLAVSGGVAAFDGAFCDDSLLPMDEWRAKHRDYARREARMVLSGRVNGNKRLYYRLPPYLRAFAYFCWRYFLRGGFLDGRAGWAWHFWQGLWYRCLVDREIGRTARLAPVS